MNTVDTVLNKMLADMEKSSPGESKVPLSCYSPFFSGSRTSARADRRLFAAAQRAHARGMRVGVTRGLGEMVSRVTSTVV